MTSTGAPIALSSTLRKSDQMPALIFDTETTDLLKPGLADLSIQPRMIEFYGVLADLDTGEELGELELLINPGHKLSDVTVRITSITDALLEDAPAFGAVAPEILAFIERADGLIAHNLSFDVGMLLVEFERIGRLEELQAILKWRSQTCTVEATEFLTGYRQKLGDLHEYLFGERFADAHRARSDTRALLRCAGELRKRDLL